MFSPEELQAIYQLISRVNITGNEAKAVAVLQQKIEGLLAPKKEVKPEEKPTPKT